MSKVGLSHLLLAGFCAGMAEVIWVGSYTAVTGSSSVDIAREITASLFPSLANMPLAPLLGIAIHFALSVALALAFGLLVWRPFASKLNRVRGALVGIALLCMVWAINFFMVLPSLNPVFVTLLPYAVTLISKVLFGAAMVWTLQAGPGANRTGIGFDRLAKPNNIAA